MSMLKYTHTRLLVSEFSACFKFYKDICDFPLILGEEDGIYAEFHTGHSVIALFRKQLMADTIGRGQLPEKVPMQDRVVLVFAVPDVDRMYEELQEKGVVFITAPHNRTHWFLRVAHFSDPDGNLLEINTSLSS